MSAGGHQLSRCNASGWLLMPVLILLLQGVEFWAVNTDAQALENTLSSNKLQLGGELTRGLGAPRYTLDSNLAAQYTPA